MQASPAIAPDALAALLVRALKSEVRAISSLRVLLAVAESGGLSMADAVRASGTTSANVTGMIDRLSEQGLIERKPKPNDRRGHGLHLTEKGADVMLAILGAA